MLRTLREALLIKEEEAIFAGRAGERRSSSAFRAGLVTRETLVRLREEGARGTGRAEVGLRLAGETRGVTVETGRRRRVRHSSEGGTGGEALLLVEPVARKTLETLRGIETASAVGGAAMAGGGLEEVALVTGSDAAGRLEQEARVAGSAERSRGLT